MGRLATFEPRQDRGKARWYVWIPARHTISGKPRREYFRTKPEAKARGDQLRSIEGRHKRLVRHAGPETVESAVKWNELAQSYGYRDLEAFCAAWAAELEQRLDAYSLEILLDEYEAAHTEGWGPRSRSTFRWLRKKMADLEPRSVASISTDDWSEWLDLHATSKRTRADLHNRAGAVLRFAVRRGKIEANPLDQIRRPRIPREEKAVLAPSDVRRLLAIACEHDPEMVPYFAIGIFAGLRPQSELAPLRWEDVNLSEGWIRVGFHSKTGSKRFVPVEPNLAAWLLPHRRKRGPVFPSNLRRRRDAIVLGKWTTTPEDLGGEKPVWANRRRWVRPVPWAPDIMRHSYGSYFDGLHRDRNLLKEAMGHADFTTYDQHYRNARTPAQAAEFWAIRPPDEGKITRIRKTA